MKRRKVKDIIRLLKAPRATIEQIDQLVDAAIKLGRYKK